MADTSRYSCQMVLDGFGAEAQVKLREAKVLIVGAGGLGCPAGQYLAAAGVGTIGIADHDVVEVKNLHRQTLYGDRDVGKLKAAIFARQLKRQNQDCKTIVINQMVIADNVAKIIEPYDVVLDCTDNFETRYLLNDACVAAGKPLVYGAIFQYEGQAAVWNVRNADGTMSPNYRDAFPQMDGGAIPNCADGGVIPTIAGVIGCVQANETIKYLAGLDGLLKGRLFIFDALEMRSYAVALPESTGGAKAEPRNDHAVPSITPAELKKSLPQETYNLIDVRSREEHAEFNIGGQTIPLPELLAALDDLDYDKPIVFYCATGGRSTAATRLALQARPEAKVMNLVGGMRDWRRQTS